MSGALLTGRENGGSSKCPTIIFLFLTIVSYVTTFKSCDGEIIIGAILCPSGFIKLSYDIILKKHPCIKQLFINYFINETMENWFHLWLQNKFCPTNSKWIWKIHEIAKTTLQCSKQKPWYIFNPSLSEFDSKWSTNTMPKEHHGQYCKKSQI